MQLVPVRDKVVSHIACGYGHTLGVVDGRVYSWGSGRVGQLGCGSTVMYSPQPTLVPEVSVVSGCCVFRCARVFVFVLQLVEVPIHRVFAGRNTSIACGSGGSMVFVWGCGDGKNLGIPGLVGDVYVPTLLSGLEGQSIVDIAITDSMCCYLTSSGCVWVCVFAGECCV